MPSPLNRSLSRHACPGPTVSTPATDNLNTSAKFTADRLLLPLVVVRAARFCSASLSDITNTFNFDRNRQDEGRGKTTIPSPLYYPRCTWPQSLCQVAPFLAGTAQAKLSPPPILCRRRRFGRFQLEVAVINFPPHSISLNLAGTPASRLGIGSKPKVACRSSSALGAPRAYQAAPPERKIEFLMRQAGMLTWRQQVLHLHIGQAGIQLGNSAWEL